MKSAFLVNSMANCYQAGKKWNFIKSHPMLQQYLSGDYFLKITDCVCEKLEINTWILQSMQKGARVFIAVGGDGTVNWLLNGMIWAARKIQIPLKHFYLGAIGAGSSNDFHKPFPKKDFFIEDLPARLDWTKSQAVDLGLFVDLENDQNNYFINNASLGLTAFANYSFNQPDRVLKFLKRYHTDLSIMFCALKSFLKFANIPLNLSIDDQEYEETTLSNLNIIKNPFFSGQFHYPEFVTRNDGKLAIFQCHDMTKKNYLYTLIKLGKGIFHESALSKIKICQSISFRSMTSVEVEWDGEVCLTKSGGFYCKKEEVMVCSP